jgi:hypothetical protein
MARKTYDTAISLCRPLYYDYPDDEQAYSRTSQYMFGDDLLVAPVSTPMKDGEALVNVWLPAGNDWYEWQTGTMLKGGQEVDRKFTIEEYPVYAKAGAVIPMYPAIKNLEKVPNQTIIGIFPGADGAADVYEDGGDSKDYAKAYAFTKVTSKHQPGRVQQVTIMPRKGSYAGMPQTRQYILKLYGAEMPQTIVVNGVKINYANEYDLKNWSYNGKELSVNIPLPVAKCSVEQHVEVYYNQTDRVDVNTGLVKNFRRLTKGITALKFKSPGIILPEAVGFCEETNLRIQYKPQNFYQAIRYFQTNYQKLPELLKGSAPDGDIEWFKNYMK